MTALTIIILMIIITAIKTFAILITIMTILKKNILRNQQTDTKLINQSIHE